MLIAETMTEEHAPGASQPHDASQAKSPRKHDPSAAPVVYASTELLQGRKEVWIEHGDQLYRLRVTSTGKLYLTK